MGNSKKEKIKVGKGQDLEKLAKNYGYKSFSEVYALAENRALRKKRPKPSDITVGDILFVEANGPKPKAVKFSKDTGRMRLSIDGDAGKIIIAQTWAYQFIKEGKYKQLDDWTDKEKKWFQKEAEKQIIKRWHKKCTMEASGKSDFARYFKGTEFKVEISLRVVSSGGHWTCVARKVPKGEESPSDVDYSKQIINLDINDDRVDKHSKIKPMTKEEKEKLLKKLEKKNEKREEKGKDRKQLPRKTFKRDVIAHEFGHTIGLVAGQGKDITRDEYGSGPYLNDRKALMNYGNQLRARYFDFVIRELNEIISQTSFRVTKVS